MISLRSSINDFFHILFPESCAGCQAILLRQESVLCTSCLFHLPLTDFHLHQDNPSARQLWGKLDFEFATSMLRMPKSSIVERTLYELKYANQPHIGVYLGRRYGQVLAQEKLAEDIDYIVPVPLHKNKMAKRGYNQAACFARGLREVLGVPVEDRVLVRHLNTVSQTKKRRLDRYDNVEAAYDCVDPALFQGKHILLVDDVLTTGATICSAGNTLITTSGCRLSVVTIARP